MTQATKPLAFRPFTIADAPLLAGWLAAEGLGVPPGIGSANWAGRLVEDPNISCWAAQEAGETVGFFRLDTGPDLQAELTVIVAPHRRRNGIGLQILEEVLKQARARSLRKILAVVSQANQDGLTFFHDAGFDLSRDQTSQHVHLQRLVHCAERQPPLEIQP